MIRRYCDFRPSNHVGRLYLIAVSVVQISNCLSILEWHSQILVYRPKMLLYYSYTEWWYKEICTKDMVVWYIEGSTESVTTWAHKPEKQRWNSIHHQFSTGNSHTANFWHSEAWLKDIWVSSYHHGGLGIPWKSLKEWPNGGGSTKKVDCKIISGL